MKCEKQRLFNQYEIRHLIEIIDSRIKKSRSNDWTIEVEACQGLLTTLKQEYENMKGISGIPGAEKLIRENMKGTRNDEKTPAWQHPIDVMIVAREMTVSCGEHMYMEEIETVALLHDIIEDSEVTPQQLCSQFGQDIANAVLRLTKTPGCRFGTPELVDYFYKIINSNDGKVAEIAKIVKCCDRIANLREAHGVFEPYRLERYIFETKMFVIPIAMSVEPQWGNWLVKQLKSLSIADSEPKS